MQEAMCRKKQKTLGKLFYNENIFKSNNKHTHYIRKIQGIYGYTYKNDTIKKEIEKYLTDWRYRTVQTLNTLNYKNFNKSDMRNDKVFAMFIITQKEKCWQLNKDKK